MKIAVISDIHGNLDALEAVMADIESEGCEKIFALGDYAMAGPEPAAVVDWFFQKQLDSRFKMIQGNTDLLNPRRNALCAAFPYNIRREPDRQRGPP